MTASAPLFAGRYRLLAEIGSGTAGIVYRAEDIVTREVVAVKVLSEPTALRLGRFEREARVLRALRLPGVVQLITEGEEEGRRFLVTELVAGAPFPGVPGVLTWSDIAPVALRLLEALAAVHDAGVLHRDLKPANVLVDAQGMPTVLDFGLAQLADAISLTRTGDVLGTPRYQAPEQILGDHPVDARADLYAVGAMLYEALSGRLPQSAQRIGRLYAARLLREAPPLASLAPDVPARVAEVIDGMLARWPDQRPASAHVVLAALSGAVSVRQAGQLPWLGGRDEEPKVIAALREGRRVLLRGPTGSGRSRLLGLVEATLRAEGVPTRRVGPGDGPYESLGLPSGRPPAGDLLSGVVLLVDCPGEVDPWSLGFLDALRGPQVRVNDEVDPVPEGDVPVVLGLLSEADLAPLFDGSDAPAAAALLWRRSAGHPGRVAAEVAQWASHGVAQWRAERLFLPPEQRWILQVGPPPDLRLGRRAALPELGGLATALAWVALAEPTCTVPELARARGRPIWEVEAELRRLEARGVARCRDGLWFARPELSVIGGWSAAERLEALRSLARSAQPGTPERLARLLAAEAWSESVPEALALADAALLGGAAGVAWGAAVWGLRAALRADGPAQAPAERLVRAALAVGTPRAREIAAASLAQAVAREPGERELVRLAGLLDVAGPPADLEPLSDPTLDATREDHAFERLLLRDPARAGSYLDQLAAAPWRVPSGGRRLWMEAQLRLAGGRAEEAVTLIERALRLQLAALERLSLRVLLADSHLQAGSLVEATTLAEAACVDAARCGRVLLAGHAHVVHREALVRAGAPPRPDVVGEMERLGDRALLARVSLAEAAAAWRTSSYEEAARLARGAIAAGGAASVDVLARALELACEGSALAEACERVGAMADAVGDPSVALQVRGLLSLARADFAVRHREEAERLALGIGRHAEPRAVLSCAEALAFCRARARRDARPDRPGAPGTG